MASRQDPRLVRGPVSRKKVNTEQAAAYQKAGQVAYKKGNLQGAIESFTQALAENSEDVGILDNRAATHCSLKQYGQARTDARNMIKLAPNDDRGYLRLAKVLCLDGNFEKARDIYEYALQKLPVEHKGRDVISNLLKKLRDKLAGGNRRDPFTALPLEIAHLILSLLTFKQLAAILRVSKGWSKFVGGLPSLWMSIDLSGARSRVPWTSVRNYIHRSRVELTNAKIENLVPASTPKVLDMLSRCPKLEHLELMVAHEQPKEFYAKIKAFRQLKSITCGPEIKLSHASIGSILSSLPQLERAAFLNVWDAPTRASRPATWPQRLPNMKSLTIASSQEDRTGLAFPNVVPGLGSATEPAFPKLEELRLIWEPARSCSYRFDPVQEGEHLPPLRVLDLRGAAIQPNLYSILPDTLHTLRFYSGSIEDNVVGGFGGNFLIPGANRLPKLNTVVFNDTPWVNQETLSLFLMDSKAPIRNLQVSFCHNIKSKDFLELLGDTNGENPELANITELGVACMADMDDINVGHLWTILRKLKALDLSQTKITGCTIRMFADTRKEDPTEAKMETLIIKGCDDVSRDAIDYGRSVGLKIIT
ncbi:Tetratricopeptide-like helical [Penicillium brevicompactum]|uniref:Tetratricopeptide-like helical n=1 Tax=Penicillium brevicompactum TaxID=5074 RepID=A0A9W9QPV8_PENBR|nr:Tetratricopeptide-like helical [Penicillium brevicompactum]